MNEQYCRVFFEFSRFPPLWLQSKSVYLYILRASEPELFSWVQSFPFKLILSIMRDLLYLERLLWDIEPR
jgi:hypothetical protein